MFLLVLLGVLAIYALILGDVEAKTYEYGMLRVLGMRHTTLATLLGLQTAAYSLPGYNYPMQHISGTPSMHVSRLREGV